MFARLRSLSLRFQLGLLGTSGVVVTAAVLIGVGAWQMTSFSTAAQTEVEKLVAADLDHITQGVMSLVEAQDEALRQQVDHNLSVAQYVLAQSGGFGLGTATASWEAVHQINQTVTVVALPQALVGGRWLGQNADAGVMTPVVDQVTQMVGGTATLFQRMNAAGDMLRVATTVPTTDGRRAIGTYIPAVNPDGASNPVVAAILQGETYHGVAYVVNAWYLTAYAPLTAADGAILGMIYVGVRQDSVPALRHALYETRVGQTGYVYILGGQGEDRGRYIVSRNGERDGEDIWEMRDADGQPVIQEIVQTALALPPGEFGTARYRWQNAGEAAPRWKIARLAYFAPYDWVIGVSAYEDEFQAFAAELQAGQARTLGIFFGSGLLLAAIGAWLSWRLAAAIARPLGHMMAVADALAVGDLRQEVPDLGSGELGALSRAFRRMTGFVREMTGVADQIAAGDLTLQVRPRSDQDELGHAFERMVVDLRGLLRQVGEAAGAVRSASDQLAAAAGPAGRATEQIAATIQQVADGTQQQTQAVTRTAAAVEQMQRAADGVVTGSQDQTQAVGNANTMARQIETALEQVAGNADAVTREAASVAQAARTGTQLVAETIAGMETLRAQVGDSAARVREMGQRSDQIGAIVETIDDIASQTNLLALNAAIEAARVDAQATQQVERLLDKYMIAAARLIAQVLVLAKPTGEPAFWDRLARLAGLEVVTVTDGDGVVVYSNEPGKAGFRFSDDPKSQTYAFRQLLHQREGVVCQGIQRRTVDRELYKFVGVSRPDQPGLVQVGLRADSAVLFRFNVAGFAVVADEVRHLAERAGAATKEIGALIRAIQLSVAAAVRAMDEGARAVEARAQHTQAAGQSLNAILQAAEAANAQAEAARQSTQAMSAAAHDLLWAMEAVSAVVESNQTATDEMAAGAREASRAIAGIASASAENAAAVDEASASAEAMSAQVRQVGLAAEALTALARDLEGAVAHFQLMAAEAQPVPAAPPVPLPAPVLAA